MRRKWHNNRSTATVQQAFSLCAVPNTGFNLSYESITSRAARQAILDLRTTNPDLYAEITSGKNDPDALSLGDEPDDFDLDDEGDAGVSVEEVRRRVQNARTVDDVTGPFEEVPEFDEDNYESEDDSIPIASNRIRISAKFIGV